MHKREIKIIPATIPKLEIKNQKIPRKLRVIVYSKVIKGTGAGVQIRKNIRRIIADYTDYVKVFNCLKLCGDIPLSMRLDIKEEWY